MNEVEKTIIRLHLLPYELGEIIRSLAIFNYGTTVRVFKYSGGNFRGRWGCKLKAGMIDFNGYEIEGKVVTWARRDDTNLDEMCKRLEELFPEHGLSYELYIPKRYADLK